MLQILSKEETKNDDCTLREDSKITFRKLYSEDENKDDASSLSPQISYDKWPPHIMLIISPSKKDKDKFKLQAFDRTRNAVLGNSKITRDELFAMHESKALHKYPVFLSPELDVASQAFFSGQAPGEVFDNQALVLYKRLSKLSYSESRMEAKALVVNSLTKVEERPKILVRMSELKVGTPICVQNSADNQKHQSLTHLGMHIKICKESNTGMHLKQQIGYDLEPLENTDRKEQQSSIALHKNKENLLDMNTKNKRTKSNTNNQSSSIRKMGSKLPSQEKRNQIVTKMQKSNNPTMKHIADKTQMATKKIVKNETSNEKNKSQVGRKELKKPVVKRESQERKEVKGQPIKNTKLEQKKLPKKPNIIYNKAATLKKEFLEMKIKSRIQKEIKGKTKKFFLQTKRKEVKAIELKALTRKAHTIFQNSKYVQEESSSQIEISDDPEWIFTLVQNSKTDEKTLSQDYQNVDQASMIIRNLNMDSKNCLTIQNIISNEALSDHKELIEIKEQIKYQKYMEENNLTSLSESNSIIKSFQNVNSEGKTLFESYMEKNEVGSDSLTDILKVVSEKFLKIYTGKSEIRCQDMDQYEIINDNNTLQNDPNQFTYISEEMSPEETDLDSITNRAAKQNETVSDNQLRQIIRSSQNSFPEYTEYENGMDNYNSEELTKVDSETMTHGIDDLSVDNMEFQCSEELTETFNINEDPTYQKEIRWSADENETGPTPSEKFIDRQAKKYERVESDDITYQEDKEKDMNKTHTTCINSKVAKTKYLKSQSKRVHELKSKKPHDTFGLPTVKGNNDKQTKNVKESKLKSEKPQQIPSKISKSKAKSVYKSKDTGASSPYGTKKKILPRNVKEEVHKSPVSSSSVVKKALPSKNVKEKVPSSVKTPVSSVADRSAPVNKKALPSKKVKEKVHSSVKSPESSVADRSSSSISKKALPSRNNKEKVHNSAKSPIQRNISKSIQQQQEENIKVKTSLVKTASSECIKHLTFAIKDEPDLQSIEEEIIHKKRDIVTKICNDDLEIIKPVIELTYSSTCFQEVFKYRYTDHYVKYVTSSISSLLEKDSSEFEMIIKQLRPPVRITIPSTVLTCCGVRLRPQFREDQDITVPLPTLLNEINFKEIPSNSHLFEFFRLANKHSFKIYARPEVVFPGYQMQPRLRLECFLRNGYFVGSVALLPVQFDLFILMFSNITAEYIEDAFHLTRLPKWLVKNLKRLFNVIHLRFVYDIMAELAYEIAQEPASMSLHAP